MNERWSEEEAWSWYDKQPWLVGCNYIVSNSVNQLEMWQSDTWDPETISRELEWAHKLGFNTIRVYLHDLAWYIDQDGLIVRIKNFLEIADRNQIRPILVFFDDCWNQEFTSGKQPPPKPGVHNSGWVQSPGSRMVQDKSTWTRLRDYIQDVIRTFKVDNRVLMWDLYNEPGNNKLDDKSLQLVEASFEWAREPRPNQPITIGVWYQNKVLNESQLSKSDIITFHNYHDALSLEKQIAELKTHGRPLICTEYMARQRNSRFETHLPIFKRYRVGCLSWGLVNGKTQTNYPWGSTEGSLPPKLWFHDILNKDGTPYDHKETEFIENILLT